MNIGGAVGALKEGLKVARAGWNGKGMWLSYTPGRLVEHGKLWSQANAEYAASQPGSMVRVLPYITMKTADGCIVPWLCSQTDLLADDWEIVP